MSNNGYLRLSRELVEKGWYGNADMLVLFIHMLFHANSKRREWNGTIIERGQFVSSFRRLAEESGLTLKRVRTSVKHLEESGELTYSGTAKYTLFTMVNYDAWQCRSGTAEGTVKGTVKGTATNMPLAGESGQFLEGCGTPWGTPWGNKQYNYNTSLPYRGERGIIYNNKDYLKSNKDVLTQQLSLKQTLELWKETYRKNQVPFSDKIYTTAMDCFGKANYTEQEAVESLKHAIAYNLPLPPPIRGAKSWQEEIASSRRDGGEVVSC